MSGLVFFDFDGTLTRRDTLWPLARLLARSRGRRRLRLARLGRDWLALKLRLISNHAFKERFARLFLAGQPEREVDRLVERFHRHCVEPVVNQAALRRLREHQAAGERVCLVSSNFDFVLSPLRTRWAVHDVVATETVVSAGVFSGELRGPACEGLEKVRRIVARFGEGPVREAVAYGDGPDDVHLLRAARRGYWVRGGRISACR